MIALSFVAVTAPEQERAALLADALRTVAGVVLLTALVLAPLNYASTRLLPFQTLIALAAAGGASWAAACALARSFPLPPVSAQIGVVLIAIAAVAWIAVLPLPEWPAFTRQHYARLVGRWPYSMVPRNFSLLVTWAMVAVVAVLAFHDLARNPAWRQAIGTVILLTGGVVALIGLLQNATHAPGIFWDASTRLPGAFFGTFFHHTSAGAYLNTAWPFGLSFALENLDDTRAHPARRRRIYGGLALTVLVLGSHAAHVSRFPQVIALAALIAFSLWTGFWTALARIPGMRTGLILGVVTLLVAVGIFGAGRLDEIRARWNLLEWSGLRGGGVAAQPPPEREWPRLMRDDLFVASDHRAYPLGDRGALYDAARRAITARPWLGWGPGGWTAAAAAFSDDPFVRTFYLTVQFTHSDYLQTLVEWGAIGALGWMLLVPGGIIVALTRLGARPARDYYGAAAVVALAAVLLQSVIDFPLQIPAVQFNAVALTGLAWSTPALSSSRLHPCSLS